MEVWLWIGVGVAIVVGILVYTSVSDRRGGPQTLGSIGAQGILKHMTNPTPITFEVVSVNHPAPMGARAAEAKLEGVARGERIESRTASWHGMIPTDRWPEAGTRVPGTLDRDDSRRLVLYWDRVPTIHERGQAEARRRLGE